MAGRVFSTALAVVAVLGIATGASAGSVAVGAAFPGRNGALVFEREVPAGDHTQTDLYVVQPDGSQLAQLTHTPDRNEFGATWNATGTKIAFWRTHAPFGPGSIWVTDAAGDHAKRLTSGVDARDPAWNPAGSRLVFTRADAGFDLWTMRASDGGRPVRLTSGSALDFEPAWSPDGTRIAFTRGFAQGDPGDIYLLNLKTSRLRRITHSPAYDHQVAWAPGGQRLVFERDFDTSSSICTVRAGDARLKRLTRGHFFDVGPAFAPGGRRIAFGSERGGVTLDDLWLMTASGANLHRILHLRYSEGFPDWQPLPTN